MNSADLRENDRGRRQTVGHDERINCDYLDEARKNELRLEK